MDRPALLRHRLAERVSTKTALEHRIGWLVRGRLVLFALFALALWFATAVPRIALGWTLLPLAGFLAVAIVHGRQASALALATRRLRWNEEALARLTGEGRGAGSRGERFLDPKHPYAADLDLFGAGSLFEGISVARTGAGEETLARWLLEPAYGGEVRVRQSAIAELEPDLDLRESLALAGEAAREAAESHRLREWSAAPPVHFTAAERIATTLLAALGVASLSLALLALFPPAVAVEPWGRLSEVSRLFVFPLVVVAMLLLQARLRHRVASVLGPVEEVGRELGLLSDVVRLFEEKRFTSARLVELSGRFAGAPRASEAIAGLERAIALLDSRRNQLFLPIAALLLWGTHLSFRLEAWRQRHGRSVIEWLEAVGEIEALVSLAGFSFEHSSWPFAEVLDGAPRLEATGLGHPLLPAEKLVRNDVTLGGNAAPMLMVSGSNMSGKSTLLRAVGINTVLALAGGPVCASSLRLTRLVPGASIGIHDSLLEGASRFWAEITRLQQIVAMAREGQPVLALLDEMLSGTNSHDRRIGAQSVLRTLLDCGTIGAVTTHDLALAAIDDPRLRNVHFEDRLEDDRILFDYRMRDGVVTRSNALELMKSLGLIGPPPAPPPDRSPTPTES